MVNIIDALKAMNVIEDQNDAWIEAGYRPKGYTLAKESDVRLPGSAGFSSTTPPSVIEFFDGTVPPEERDFVLKLIERMGEARMRIPTHLGK